MNLKPTTTSVDLSGLGFEDLKRVHAQVLAISANTFRETADDLQTIFENVDGDCIFILFK